MAYTPSDFAVAGLEMIHAETVYKTAESSHRVSSNNLFELMLKYDNADDVAERSKLSAEIKLSALREAYTRDFLLKAEYNVKILTENFLDVSCVLPGR